MDDDLILCHQEPIRIPGSVQPHGVLLALEGPDLRVRLTSASLEPLLDRSPGTALGATFGTLFGEGPCRAVRTAVDALGAPVALPRDGAVDAAHVPAIGVAGGPDRDGTESTASGAGRPVGQNVQTFELTLEVRGEALACDAAVHRVGSLLVLEIDNLRPTGAAAPRADFTIGGIQRLTRRLHAARSLSALCETIVEEVRALTGFDRVMVYRFHEDGHGEVVAESVIDGWTPYLGLHYPEGDIPAQARELYRRNWIRCITAVPYTPSPILPADAEPLDLGFSHLRSVSPIHVEYLRNMGVGASMSISLLDGDRLWGLVACHHGERRHLSAAARTACELLGTTFSLLLPSLEATREAITTAALRDIERELLAQMAESVPFVDGAFANLPNLGDLVAADGVASISGAAVKILGATPIEAQIVAFAAWLDETVREDVFATVCIREHYPDAAHWPGGIVGALVIEISRKRGQYLMAFRNERVQSVRWAGRPDEKHVVASADGEHRRLSPRRSFALWEESVEGVSLPWRAIEVRCAETLRRTTLKLIVNMAEEVLRLNRELERSRDDLRSFAHIAAHDLKEPLRGINNYVAFLLEDHGAVLDREARAKIETIARLANRGSGLTSALLDFAELSQAGQPVPFDLGELVDEVLEMFAPELARRGIEMRVQRPLPTLVGERVHMTQILGNLIGNAIKYGEGRGRWIAIEAEPSTTQSDAWLGAEHLDRRSHLVRVRDNGIGIASEHHADVFKLFKRLNVSDRPQEGNGMGLTIVKRIVELHGGHIGIDSEPGVGTTFHFTFGEPPDADGTSP